ncbi:MAG TPA: hypothetical protein DHV28_11085 [Ignavibacteriales bacterium]|nr:hypothetical protein [Ignavibacteriales bacterium]
MNEHYLSNIELYYCSSLSITEQCFHLTDEEFYHAKKVMRHSIGDKIFATDGKGKIFEGRIENINRDSIKAEVVKEYNYSNRLSHFTFCIPNLKNPDRFKFALEKCTELGITNFIIFNSERSVSKGFNLERINKLLLSSAKQSLQAYLPMVKILDSISLFNDYDSQKILFEQNSDNKISDMKFDNSKKYLMLFGPEGGFTEKEISEINPSMILNLSQNRLRTETAIVKAASIIS